MVVLFGRRRAPRHFAIAVAPATSRTASPPPDPRFSTAMGRSRTLALLLLVALASLARADEVQSPSHALRREEAPAQEPVALSEPLPVLALDEASSAANETAPAAVPTPTHHTAAPAPEPSYHPVFGLIFAALALCVTSNVKDQNGIVSTASNAGILTTIYTLVLNLDLQAAVALSAVTLTGRSLAVFVDNIRDSARDTAASPLIDWDLLLVVEPSLLIGVLLGIFLRNVALPGWLVSTILATALLVCGSLLLQASHRRTEETPAPEVSINEESSLIDPTNPTKRPATGPAPPFSVAIQTTPLSKLGVLVGVVFAIAVLQAALVVAVPLVLLGYLAYKAYKAGFDSFERQQLPRAAPTQGELKWTIRIVRTMPVVAVLAGTATGTFGFGSELIFVPFLISAGLDGAIANATGATIVLLSSLLVALECVVLGSVGFTVWLLAMILGFVAKEYSHLALERALSGSAEAFRKPSFLAFSFACITLLAGVALAIAST